MMKRFFAAMLISSLAFGTAIATEIKEKSEVDQKVDALLSKMTLDEKIGQLNQYTSRWEMTGPAPKGQSEQELLDMIKSGKVGSMLNVTGAEATRNAQQLAVENSRLGIPMIFGYDVVHGYKTMFPIPLATAASWEPAAAELSASVAAKETAASGVHWTFAPMVDIARDARWGRIMEGAGEDPYLGSVMAAAQVRGFQGASLADENTIAACAKHFAAYGFAEAGRDYNTVEITENTLRNVVLPPFKACADAGVASFMNSFNEIGGVLATANNHLLRDILKGEWNFDGFVVSDWNSIGEIVDHGVAPNKKEAAYLAMKAGSDMDMEGNCYVSQLKELVEEGRIDEALIDDAVRRILKIKFELGLFDDPYRYSNPEKEKTLLNAEHLQAAREVAKKSIVLLKNENQLLPLKKSGQRIAVIGDMADDKDSPLGSWRAQAVTGSAVSLLEGMKNTAADPAIIQFEQGPVFVSNEADFTHHLEFNETDLSGIDEAVALAKQVDVVVMALGENCFQSGEGRSQTDITLKGVQQQLLEAVYAANPNVVVVLMNGRPLVINWMAEHVPAILETWHLGSEAGNAIADVLFGDYNPSGKLPVSFPRAVGQCPIYYNHKSTGRPFDTGLVFWSHYTDESNEPLYPFGYGLSYTTFAYSDLKLSSSEFGLDEEITVSVKVENTGNYAGEEVVQLYIRDLFGSITRPVKELKGFEKISLAPGESKVVEFELSANDLAFYTAEGKWQAEPGDFLLWVGTHSQEGLEAAFSLK
ncbi:beta-glucosidase BglX [Gaoshiqia sediminis]|uniref:Periplasmic beta-glucosidase n=1 Tax=Gaoshiqia sediminis TaxID=2986998 RepID=A0AA41Y9S8_9BACT|nr:beta-glucosidase BglX [Gaoshiqia sediminis]MCW0484809.1 beta-glucosidase BglX [Gaoshiqia sediminis]